MAKHGKKYAILRDIQEIGVGIYNSMKVENVKGEWRNQLNQYLKLTDSSN